MSYVPDFARIQNQKDAQAYSDLLNWQDRTAYAERELANLFYEAVMKGDMKAPAVFAPMTQDFKAPVVDGQHPLRYPTVYELMSDSLDYTNGPSFEEAMAVLSNAARGDVDQSRVKNLVERMAITWAHFNVGYVE